MVAAAHLVRSQASTSVENGNERDPEKGDLFVGTTNPVQRQFVLSVPTLRVASSALLLCASLNLMLPMEQLMAQRFWAKLGFIVAVVLTSYLTLGVSEAAQNPSAVDKRIPTSHSVVVMCVVFLCVVLSRLSLNQPSSNSLSHLPSGATDRLPHLSLGLEREMQRSAEAFSARPKHGFVPYGGEGEDSSLDPKGVVEALQVEHASETATDQHVPPETRQTYLTAADELRGYSTSKISAQEMGPDGEDSAVSSDGKRRLPNDSSQSHSGDRIGVEIGRRIRNRTI